MKKQCCKTCGVLLIDYSKKCDTCQVCVDTTGQPCACGEGVTPEVKHEKD